PASATRWPRRCDRTRCGTRPVSPVISMALFAPMPPANSGMLEDNGPRTQSAGHCEFTMSELTRIAVFGGIYSNHLALRAALEDVNRRKVDAVFCLGDLGAFGPHPDRVVGLLREHGVQCIQGNYDNSIGSGLADCQCGYTDPRDNHFA